MKSSFHKKIKRLLKITLEKFNLSRKKTQVTHLKERHTLFLKAKVSGR
jgi:hypothetical protein